MRGSSSSIIALNSCLETPSEGRSSVETRSGQGSESLTAIEQNTLGKSAHRCPELFENMLGFTQSYSSRLCGPQARTTHMSFMSCMSPCGRVCVPILETYLVPLLSILPTREVVDGQPRDPGGGCVMSAAGEKRI